MAEKELRLGYVRGRDGTNGKDGVDGKSPYQAAVEEGYTGTEEQLYAALASLIGAPFLPTAGGTMTGPLNMSGQKISFLGAPEAPADAVTKDYVDKAKEALSKSIDGKTSKTPPAESGNLAALDEEGNLTDSGKKASDFTGKRVCRFVVGTSTAGWTAADCDYLCDGTDDQVEINAAIQALPSTGGEAVILDGTYNITSAISVSKDNVKLSGNGASTVLVRNWGTDIRTGVITIESGVSKCKISGFFVDGNVGSYSGSTNDSILLKDGSSHNEVSNNIIVNSRNGILVEGSHYNVLHGNLCKDGECGIYLYTRSSGNVVANNICSNNVYRTSFGGGIDIFESDENTVVGNVCNGNAAHGIKISSGQKNMILGNIVCDNGRGIQLVDSSKNNISGNIALRGDGLSSDYGDNDYTIYLYGSENNYNLISGNIILGKNYVSQGGTSNTFTDNKYQ